MPRIDYKLRLDPLDMDLLRRVQKAGGLIPYREAKDSGYLGSYYRELDKGTEDSKIWYRLNRLVEEGYMRKVEGSNLKLTEKGLGVLRNTILIGVCSGRISMSVVAETGKNAQLKVNTDGITAIRIDQSTHRIQGIDNIEVPDGTQLTVWVERPDRDHEEKERKENSAEVQVVGGAFKVEKAEKHQVNAWISGTYTPQLPSAHRFDDDRRGVNSDKFARRNRSSA